MLTAITTPERQPLSAMNDNERPSPLPFRFELGQKVQISGYPVEAIVLSRTYTWLGKELYTIRETSPTQLNDFVPAQHVRVILGDVLTAASEPPPSTRAELVLATVGALPRLTQ